MTIPLYTSMGLAYIMGEGNTNASFQWEFTVPVFYLCCYCICIYLCGSGIHHGWGENKCVYSMGIYRTSILSVLLLYLHLPLWVRHTSWVRGRWRWLCSLAPALRLPGWLRAASYASPVPHRHPWSSRREDAAAARASCSRAREDGVSCQSWAARGRCARGCAVGMQTQHRPVKKRKKRTYSKGAVFIHFLFLRSHLYLSVTFLCFCYFLVSWIMLLIMLLLMLLLLLLQKSLVFTNYVKP